MSYFLKKDNNHKGSDVYLYGKGPLKTQETYEEANIQFSNTNFPERALIKL